MRIINNKKQELISAPRKDWADVAYGWPFFILPCLAGMGMVFSRLIVDEMYNMVSFVLASFTTTYFIIAGIKRYKTNRFSIPSSAAPLNKPFFLLIAGFIYLISFGYFAFAYGVTYLFDAFSKQEQRITAIVSGKSSGNKRYNLQSKELITFPACGLCVNKETRDRAKLGDKMIIKGRKSIFGLYVDHVTLISANKTHQPTAKSGG